MFRQGYRIEGNALLGGGVVYGLRLDSLDYRMSIPLDSVAAMESIHETVNVPKTLLFSALGVAAVLAIVAGMFSQDYTDTSPPGW